MRTVLLFLLLALLARPGRAQDGNDSLSQLLFRAWEEKRYDEAVRLARTAVALRTDTFGIVSGLEIAHTLNLLRLPSALQKDALRDAINEGPRRSAGQKREWGVSLAAIYIAERRFDSALYILDYSLRIPERQRCFDFGDFSARHQHKRMLALEGLGLRDSAINVFMPHSFRSVSGNECRTGEEEYAQMVGDFVRILRLRYSDAELARAVEEMPSQSGLVETKGGILPMYKVGHRFVTRFLGREFAVHGGGFFGPDDAVGERLKLQRDALRNSVLSRLLRAVPPAYATLAQ
ncbi:hypothetical protein [Flaviaesturariibacter amylovorans]|uniref:Tetratricopeptide repeat protein n=1 Tax=Flaviaesturariibacter amylovorans TaxID=1084520 RepID=A0ABP8H398_9BACT